MKINNFEDLRIWQLARELVRDIYALLATNQDFGFNSQIQRAAVSIMNNIAEDLGYINAEEANSCVIDVLTSHSK